MNTHSGSPSPQTHPAGGLIDIETALARVREAIAPVTEHERLPLQEAFGRTLADAVTAPIDVPAFRNSAVDGFALRAADLAPRRPLRIVGTALAGRPYTGPTPEGSCVRIMTGAVVPESCDTVVMLEDVSVRDGLIDIVQAPSQGDNVRLPGDDIRHGTVVVPAGRRLSAAELGLLASLGVASVEVVRKIRVVFLSTGDELIGPASLPTPGKIYDSNRHTLRALLQRPDIKAIDLGIIPDEPAAIERAFTEAAQLGDIVITSGGVSVGEADYVKPALQRLGQIGFWKIAIKPGKPLAFGTLGKARFFGLPGNPVSAMVTYLLIVRPALDWISGAQARTLPRLRARTLTKLRKQPGRQDYQRGVFSVSEAGELEVQTTGTQGSHVLSSMAQANCLIVLPRAAGDLPAGSLVEIMPLRLDD